MTRPEATAHKTGPKLWHMVLAIVAVALVLRLSLGALPDHAAQHADTGQDEVVDGSADTDLNTLDLAAVEVLPIDLQGEVPGPLLTSILQRYMPESTSDHADALRDTLPPSDDPRMIVIIPEDDDDAMF